MTIIYAMDESNVYSKPQLHIEMSEPRLRNAAPISVNIFESDEFLTTFRVSFLKSSKENLLKAQPIIDSIISEIAGERPDGERIVLAAEKIEDVLEFNREYSLTKTAEGSSHPSGCGEQSAVCRMPLLTGRESAGIMHTSTTQF